MAVTTTLYDYDPYSEEFLLREFDENGNQIGEPRKLEPEEWLRGVSEARSKGAPFCDRRGDRIVCEPTYMQDETDYMGFVSQGLEKIYETSPEDLEQIQRIRAGIVKVNTIESLERYGIWDEEETRRIYPDRDQRLQNFRPPEEPTPVPSNRIDGSDSQGTGPLPPAPSVGGEQDQADGPGADGALRAEDSGGQGTASSPQSDSGKTGGDPLILFSGQLYHQVTDLEAKGRGLHFSFTRTYLNQTLYKGPLGYNWDHTYNLWLREEQEVLPDGTLQNVVYRSTGQLREDRYAQVVDVPTGELPPLDRFADAVFQGPAGFFDRLEKSGGRYVLETATGVRFEYNEDLYAERIVDLNGNEISFDYDPASKLLRVVRDPVGKEFVFDYDGMNRVEILRDVTGARQIRYTYGDNGDLEAVVLDLKPDLVAGTVYRYSGPDHLFDLQHNLVEIVSPMGQSVLESEYGADPDTWDFNRVVRQRSADGEYRYEYGPLFETPVDPGLNPINVPQTFTRVFHPNSHCIEHWFNDQGNVVRRAEQVLGASGFSTLVASYRYNEDGLLIEEVRPDGGAMEYRYEREAYADLHGGDASEASATEQLAFGNLLRTLERPRAGFGETRRIVTDYTYHARGNRMKSQRGPYYAGPLLNELSGQTIGEVQYEYDERSNLTRIGYPNVEQPDGTTRAVAPSEFAYDEHGLVTGVSAGANHARYLYFEDALRSGFVREKIEDAEGAQRRTRYDVDLLGRLRQTIDHYGATTDVEWTTFDTPKAMFLPEVTPGAPRPTVSYTYDRSRQPTRVRETLLRHDGSSHPDRELVQSFRYDAYGRPTEHRLGSAAASDSRTRRIAYNPSGLPSRQTDFLGNPTFTKYNERLLPSAQTSGCEAPEQVIRRMRYNRSGELVARVDGRGYTTAIERDAFGRSRVIRDPDGNETEMSHDAAGRVIGQKLYGFHPETGLKIRWAETKFRYDAVGSMIEQVDHLFVPGEPGTDTLLITRYFYDSLNRLVTVVDAVGGRQEFGYDGLGRVTFVRDAAGNETTLRYDDARRMLTAIEKDVGKDELGKRVTQVFRRVVKFDSRGLPVETTDSAGNIVRQGFDSRGEPAYLRDASGQEFFTERDAYGQSVAYRTLLAGREVRTQLFYDANGNVTDIVGPNGGKTVWTYDSLNRRVVTERDAARSTFGYDAEGNVLLQRDENGVMIRRTYTPAGLLRTEEPDLGDFSPPDGAPSYQPAPTSASRFAYTPFGRLARTTNGVADLLVRYDSLGRTIEERANGRSVAYRYDGLGRQTGLTFPGGRDLGFDYDPVGGLTAVRQNAAGAAYPGIPAAPASRTLVSIWRVGERPLVLRFGNSHLGKLSYDVARRAVSMNWTRLSNKKPLVQERNIYGSRDDWSVHQLDETSRLFGYDALGRLVRADDYDSTSLVDVTDIAPAESEADLPTAAQQSEIDALVASLKARIGNRPSERTFRYQLDDNTNRLQTVERLTAGSGTTTTAYVPDGQDRYQSVGSTTPVYDLAGNLLADGRNSYRYDAYNNLAEVQTPSGSLTLSRDPLARPIQLHGPTEIEESIFAGTQRIEWRNNGTVAGQVVPLERPHQYAHLATEGTDYAPLFDAMDSVLGWVRPDGTIAGRSSYDPFGQVLQRGTVSPAPFGFAGYWHEEFSQTYLLPARAYHPRFGRFLQRDPLGYADGTNLYAYARHAPGTLTDYWGFSSNDIDWGTVALEGLKTVAIGGAIIAGGAALVGAGLVSAPVLALVGGIALVGMGINAYFVRASESLDAGQTDFSGRAALAAAGDALPLNVTGLYEGVTGRSVVTDRALGTQRRSAVVGGLFGGAALGPLGGSLGRVGGKLGKRLPGSSTRATNLEAVTSTVPVAQQPVGKEQKLLTAGVQTTLTIEEVAQLQGTGYQRGKAFEQWTIKANRGWKPRGVRVAGGMRYHDAAQSITTRIEAKNYWEPVPLNDFIRRQVRKDVDWLREGLAKGERRWVRWEFAGAGPSPKLAAYLQRWAPEGISAIVHGANQ